MVISNRDSKGLVLFMNNCVLSMCKDTVDFLILN